MILSEKTIAHLMKKETLLFFIIYLFIYLFFLPFENQSKFRAFIKDMFYQNYEHKHKNQEKCVQLYFGNLVLFDIWLHVSWLKLHAYAYHRHQNIKNISFITLDLTFEPHEMHLGFYHCNNFHLQ